jgi:hypothetical protein
MEIIATYVHFASLTLWATRTFVRSPLSVIQFSPDPFIFTMFLLPHIIQNLLSVRQFTTDNYVLLSLILLACL